MSMSSQLVLKYVRDEGYVNVVKQNHQCKRMGQIKFETTSCSRQGLKSDFGFDGDPAGRGPKRGYSSVDADIMGANWGPHGKVSMVFIGRNPSWFGYTGDYTIPSFIGIIWE